MKAGIGKKERTVLVVGGGGAGITAALDLAHAGIKVHLIEREDHLGGQISHLDKLYPTDHCAFCPLWTEIRACLNHPLISIHTRSLVKEMKKKDGGWEAGIEEATRYIDERKCIYCGRCEDLCPLGAVKGAGDHVYPPTYVIDEAICTRCGACIEACPTKAIDLHCQEREISLKVDQVIWATGFEDMDISPFEEYGYGTHPDILTSLEFEEWIAEAGPNRGRVVTRKTGTAPKHIAFIQCAGSRDKRLLPYCTAVCCMHALKQAQWVGRRNPAVHSTIFFTDLRTEGRHYYDYYLREAEFSSLELIRGRPGMICSLPSGEGIAVKYEDTVTRKIEVRHFDMVVLNGALRPSLKDGNQDIYLPLTDREGLVTPSLEGALSCGFCREPADVETSAFQASSAAMRAFLGAKGDG